jgi:mRNA-degrading endonuclease YafQ of YafQ-DinJ toxin-antitoxin module
MTNFAIEFTPEYLKLELIFLRKHPDMKDKYHKLLKILEVNPFYPSLRTHKLKGRFKDLYSVSINMQYRIVINFILQDNKLIPINIGDHDIY